MSPHPLVNCLPESFGVSGHLSNKALTGSPTPFSKLRVLRPFPQVIIAKTHYTGRAPRNVIAELSN